MDTDSGKRMADAAAAFLDSLAEEQRGKARLDFADASERENWHYVPRERAGLPLKEMDDEQRKRALALVANGLSDSGYQKATIIMSLEEVLAEIEGPGRSFVRDPDLYYLSLFGSPGDDEPWGWRFEGHHISLNFTLVDGCAIGLTPGFFGANPARVLHGAQEGLRALKEEEDVARELLHGLDGEQRKAAIVAAEAPPDILTGPAPHLSAPLSPAGLPGAEMDAGQRALLRALIGVYAGRFPRDANSAATGALEGIDWNRIHFAWMGSAERGGPHYYRVQSPVFLAEYDNTQNDANHIHAVWRDVRNDFGADLLRRHYLRDHS
ncbi:MAG: DUF3500 domain-containing protein [Gemmatimonadetes bacterium]|mgnify:FL=1|jgi:hypothetical protein|nr:DUF3500 domain-containing protein [Gemmatimonadota bacterium]